MQPIPPLPTPEQVFGQTTDLAGLPAVIAIGLGAMLIVAVRDWRILLAAFTVLSLGLALLTAAYLPAEWAVVRVISAGLIAIMWYLSAQRAGWGGRFLPFESGGGTAARPLDTSTLFRLLLALALAAILLASRFRLPLPPLVPPDVRLAITWLAAFALLGLALGEEALQAGAALLMWLMATTLVVISLRQLAWLLWLLSSVELLVGLATGYLMVARGPARRAGDGA